MNVGIIIVAIIKINWYAAVYLFHFYLILYTKLVYGGLQNWQFSDMFVLIWSEFSNLNISYKANSFDSQQLLQKYRCIFLIVSEIWMLQKTHKTMKKYYNKTIKHSVIISCN